MLFKYFLFTWILPFLYSSFFSAFMRVVLDYSTTLFSSYTVRIYHFRPKISFLYHILYAILTDQQFACIISHIIHRQWTFSLKKKTGFEKASFPKKFLKKANSLNLLQTIIRSASQSHKALCKIPCVLWKRKTPIVATR